MVPNFPNFPRLRFQENTEMSKTLYVSSAVQAALMTQIFIPELIDGFWKNHRPAGHGDVWRDVEVKVSEDGKLGTEGFETPRNYNFLNLDYYIPNEAKLVGIAQAVKANSTDKSVKKELIELGRIVANRLVARDGEPVKLYRGNHKPGTVTVSSARARQAAQALANAATAPVVTKPAAKTVKKTVTKTKPVEATADDGVITTTTSQGAKVRRVPVKAAEPTEATKV